jgi:hypothetical protein
MFRQRVDRTTLDVRDQPQAQNVPPMRQRTASRGFLSSVGVENTAVALIAGLLVIVYLFFNAIGSDSGQPDNTAPTSTRQSSGSGIDIDGLKI